jgi:predicted ATPase
MIKRFQVKNYKALHDVTLDLTPLHVLIGPNDSGKTSLLEAIGAICRSVDRPLAQAFEGNWQGRELVWQHAEDPVVGLHAEISHSKGDFCYQIEGRFSGSVRSVVVANEVFRSDVSTAFPSHNGNQTAVSRVVAGERFKDPVVMAAASRVADALRGVHYYRWVPRMLGLPAAPAASQRFQMDSTGFGLARCLDDILGYDRERFIALEQRLRQVFPNVETIRLKQEPAFRSETNSQDLMPVLSRADGKGIYVKFHNQPTDVPARQLSDGLLLVLAYLSVLYLPEPPRVMLVEEPENGIHPSRLREVLQMLRNVVEEQSHTQLLLTTHSPYVVDEFTPEQVTLCVKQPDGAVSVRQLSESSAVRRQIDVFTLGEIWTADGDDRLLKANLDGVESGG